MKKIDISNTIVGNWLVGSTIKKVNGIRYWECKCVCGTTKFVATTSLLSKTSLSCGCNRVKKNSVYKHPLYKTYSDMFSKCYDKNSILYKTHGKIGIKVCHEWDSFLQFVKDMDIRPKDHKLRRCDSSLDFTPTNCYWGI